MPFGLCNDFSDWCRSNSQASSGSFAPCNPGMFRNIWSTWGLFSRGFIKSTYSECQLLQKVFSYLGHIISQDGVSPDPEKIAKVCDFPVPVDVCQMSKTFFLLSEVCSRICQHCISLRRKTPTLSGLQSASC